MRAGVTKHFRAHTHTTNTRAAFRCCWRLCSTGAICMCKTTWNTKHRAPHRQMLNDKINTTKQRREGVHINFAHILRSPFLNFVFTKQNSQGWSRGWGRRTRNADRASAPQCLDDHTSNMFTRCAFRFYACMAGGRFERKYSATQNECDFLIKLNGMCTQQRLCKTFFLCWLVWVWRYI